MDPYKHKGLQMDSVESFLHYRHGNESQCIV